AQHLALEQHVHGDGDHHRQDDGHDLDDGPDQQTDRPPGQEQFAHPLDHGAIPSMRKPTLAGNAAVSSKPASMRAAPSGTALSMHTGNSMPTSPARTRVRPPSTRCNRAASAALTRS